ncbi:MAG: SRPBCC family protein [Actinocatenispora sp.]
MANKTTGLTDVIGRVRDTAAKNPATERLLHELEGYLGAQAKRAVGAVGSKVGDTTKKLGDVADGKAPLGGMLGGVAKEMSQGAGPGKAVLKAGVKNIGSKIKSAFKGSGSRGGKKSMNIIEDVNVGVPVRTAYNQWSMIKDVSKWSKGTQSVNQNDELKSSWRAKIAFSTRNWNSTITEMVPDQRIAWTSEGAKGVVNGAVTFHPMGDNLTKVLLVLEYFPGGLFEKTANLWRAQGRRARLDLKLFRRYVMTNPDAGQEGWRGEIRDGEVVKSHEDAVAEEEEREQRDDEARDDEDPRDDEAPEDEYDEEEPEEQPEDEYDDEAPEDEYDDEEPEDEYEEEEPDEEPEDEYDEEEPEEEPAEEPEEEPRPARRSRGRRARSNA